MKNNINTAKPNDTKTTFAKIRKIAKTESSNHFNDCLTAYRKHGIKMDVVATSGFPKILAAMKSAGWVKGNECESDNVEIAHAYAEEYRDQYSKMYEHTFFHNGTESELQTI